MESNHKTIIVVVALICLTVLTVYALSQGINGTLLASVLGIFGVIIGAIANSILSKSKT